MYVCVTMIQQYSIMYIVLLYLQCAGTAIFRGVFFLVSDENGKCLMITYTCSDDFLYIYYQSMQ